MLLRSLSVIVALSLGLVGCSSREAPFEDVDRAAALFFERLKMAQYEVIYEDSSPSFKAQKTEIEVIDNLKQITALGRPESFSRVRMGFDKDGERRVAFPVYAVPLEKAKAEIALTFRDDAGEWKLLGFTLTRTG
jgi:hypothetical protein